MDKIIQIKDLVISFRTINGKVQAVRDINFELFKGETLAIVGESGSGKSVTSRAIMGILAGNSIIESGEILYGEQDLLALPESEMVKIRGDKISMIFQDPLSSLNPIVKVGKQLTEAMIIKAKGGQRNARRNFNRLLQLLEKNMIEARGSEKASASDIANIKEKCKTFDMFCVESIRIEDKYNSSRLAIQEATDIIDDLLLHYDKQVRHPQLKYNISKLIRHLSDYYDEFLVAKTPENEEIFAQLRGITSVKSIDPICAGILRKSNMILKAALDKQKPDFFSLGFYIYSKKAEAKVNSFADELVSRYNNIGDMNIFVKECLNDKFLNEFVSLIKDAIKNSYNKSIAKKKEVLAHLDKAIDYFSARELDKVECKKYLEALSKEVESTIDMLFLKKDSFSYTFKSSFVKTVQMFFNGIKKNPKEQMRFEKQTAKRERLIKKGIVPSWKITPPALTELSVARENIKQILQRLRNSYVHDIENADKVNIDSLAIDLIEYFKSQASAIIYKVTRFLAKSKALRLLEEVGIHDPLARYKQYPFELSGGMRQRIVIAIALAANPEILICDEPTTALDVTIQAQILELINRIKAERNLSVIFITHDLGVVANMADRIAVMYAGKIVELGKSEDVFYDPRHPYTIALLSSMPDLDTKEKLVTIPGIPPNMIYPPKGDAFAERNINALEIDFEQEPPMFEVSPTHRAATWNLHPDAPKIDLPIIIKERIRKNKKGVEYGNE